MKAVVLDYGVGNLHSITAALVRCGAAVDLVSDATRALDGDLLVLPGVGAFTPAAERLHASRGEIAAGLRDGHPCIGICLGMQLLFQRSEEGPGSGLGIFEGQVMRLTTETVPHMGWNTLEDVSEPAVREAALRCAYFANSFVCDAADPAAVRAWTCHEGTRFPSVVRQARTLGVQFHPEKSSRAGLAMLAGFLEEIAA